MSFLADALIFLSAAVIVVPALKRLGMSSVLGYLSAGVVIGPAGLSLVRDPEAVLRFSEIGVVLLLFVIGLELQPRRLWVMRRLVFGLGSAQVTVTTGALVGVLVLLGLAPGASLLLGFALALSSTAFVLQLLAERRKLSHHHGRAAFGTLLLQDVAVIPAIAAVNLLASDNAPAGAAVLRIELVLAVSAGAVALRYLLRPVLRFVAVSGVQELFTAAALALVAGSALAMGEAGLSMGLGAFVAGMMVADSEYRHELQADVDPFKGLLLGLFFMAVGMTVNLELLAAEPALILGLTAGLMALKALLLVPLARWHGLDRREALRAALVLAQGGEFAFVLLTAAVGAGLVGGVTAETAVLVVTLSMAATPLLVSAGDRYLDRAPADERPFDSIETQSPSVVVAGFGRVGQIVARVLTMRHIPFTALEINPHQVDFVRRMGNKVFYGDATRLDVLRSAGVPKARVLVLAVGNQDASLAIVERVHATCPGVAIVARATTRDHELLLRELGVDFVLRDTLHSSLRLARALLERLGATPDEAQRAVDRFEHHDAETLARQAVVFRDEEAYRRTTLSATEELEHLFEEDASAAPEAATEHRPWRSASSNAALTALGGGRRSSGTAGEHRAAHPLTCPIGAPASPRLVLGMLVVGTPQHVLELFDHGEITPLSVVDRELGQVVAQHELRIHRVHSGSSSLRIGGFVPQPLPILVEPPADASGLVARHLFRHIEGVADDRERVGAALLRIRRRHLRQSAIEQRHVGLGDLQRVVQLVEKRNVHLRTQGVEPQLREHHVPPAGEVALFEALQPVLQRFRSADEGIQRVGELHQVPMGDTRLPAEPVAAAAGVRGIGGPVGIVVVEPAIGTVIDGEPEHRHVVGVHDAVHEPHPHPLDDHPRRTITDLAEPGGRARRGLSFLLQMREIGTNRVVEESLQQLGLAPRGEHLEMTEAGERRRHPAYHGPGLRCRMPVVKHVAHDLIAGQRQRQRPRGGHAEMVHGFAAQELADRRPQHGVAVRGARVRRGASALELQHPVLAAGVHHLAEVDGPPVAELAGPVAELMTTVAGGVRVHAGKRAIAGEHVGEHIAVALGGIEPHQLSHLRPARHQPRCRRRGRLHPREQRLAHLAARGARAGIRRQLAGETVVELETVEAASGGRGVHGKLDRRARAGSA